MDSDLDLLPPNLARRSLCDQEIVLNYTDTLSALDHLDRKGKRVLGWEGWLRYADGSCGHSAQHQGTVSLEALTAEQAVALCRETIAEAQTDWSRHPERPDAELYFCITVD